MHNVVFITASNKKEARRIAEEIIKNRLAACVNIIGNIDSLFWWEGKVDSAKEALLIVKTKRALIKKLIKKVKSLHSYKVPEIIALSIAAGSKDYLDWISECTR